MLNNGQYVSAGSNGNTGQPERQWLEYADGVFEPVRRDGNLSQKFHGNKRSLDWWTVDKPLDWSPQKAGKPVSLNHDFGQKVRFKAGTRGTPDGTGSDGQPGAAKSAKPVSGESTLTQGAAGLWEFEARRKAETASDATEGAKPQGEGESWAYRFLVPPLWKPDGHPEKEWAKEILKEKLEGFAQGVLGVPDPVVDSVYAACSFCLSFVGGNICCSCNFSRLCRLLFFLQISA